MQADREAKVIWNRWETATVVGQLPYIWINEGWAQGELLTATAGIEWSPTRQRFGFSSFSVIRELKRLLIEVRFGMQ